MLSEKIIKTLILILAMCVISIFPFFPPKLFMAVMLLLGIFTVTGIVGCMLYSIWF